jgi:hypothetical protein
VLVPVVDIRIMRMTMPGGGMAVRVRVTLRAIYSELVLVLVMGIVGMFVRMLHREMLVFVHMGLGQVQPQAHAHQCRGDPECRPRRLAQHHQRDQGAHERCGGEVRPGARGAQVAQRKDEQHQAQPVPAEARSLPRVTESPARTRQPG